MSKSLAATLSFVADIVVSSRYMTAFSLDIFVMVCSYYNTLKFLETGKMWIILIF